VIRNRQIGVSMRYRGCQFRLKYSCSSVLLCSVETSEICLKLNLHERESVFRSRGYGEYVVSAYSSPLARAAQGG
jgi:hypothetical protein